MIVSLIDKKCVNSIILPDKVRGQYWLHSCDDGTSQIKSVRIEAVDGLWTIKSSKNSNLVSINGEIIKESTLEEAKFYQMLAPNNEKFCVFTEPITYGRKTFSKYFVESNTELKIGRAEDCDIIIDDELFSNLHANLSFNEGSWYIKDLNSANGVFVNRKRVQQQKLNIGDCIYIMGFKLIIGKNFIAFNNPLNKVRWCRSKLLPYTKQKLLLSHDEEYTIPEPNYFYRSTKFKRTIKEAEFKIDPPPQSPLAEEMPMILVLGSTFAMGIMSVVMLITAIASNNMVSAFISGSMVFGSGLMPIITKKYERRRKLKKENIRKIKYKEYLENIGKQIDKEIKLQKDILNENIISVQDCEEIINSASSSLWSRVSGNDDFLQLRLGLGRSRLNAVISYPERKFSLANDILQDELYSFCEKPKILEDIPISYSLCEDYISCIVGKNSQIIEFIKGIIIQVAALHSYDEVKLVFIYDETQEDHLNFVKWLPHVWSDDKKFRFIATNLEETKELSAYLERIFEERINLSENDIQNVSPYFVVFSISWNLSTKMEILRRISSAKRNLHFSLISLSNNTNNVPKDSNVLISLSERNRAEIYNKKADNNQIVSFNPDIYVQGNTRSLSTKLANISLDNFSKKMQFPQVITFLEMFDVAKVEHLNVLSRWQDNNPSKSLAVPVGVDVYGELLTLDLHEKFHGPHGLIAGMTGSGKSEFIITYILSLAVNYHPHEVAFVLIDYKGGGMAKTFETLPHTVGVITNLDGSAIKRSLLSIESELKRRQKIFVKISQKLGMSNIDIYKYQKLYREKVVSEPLQHLFIISDEFAELKTQQPEFMAQLISAARIGRSLGVHLILATQKPSGVVDDQIWSNSRFKVCLKVQEKSDSMDVLKCPDAAKLINTGRFYLQVGYNELFEQGQSAWAGAAYYPADKCIKKRDESIIVIDNNGHAVIQVSPNKNPNLSKNESNQLEVIINYLKLIADEEKIKSYKLWMDPLPAVILLDEIKNKYPVEHKKYHLNPIIGEYDDPSQQRQCVLTLPISEEGNTVVFGMAGSGKTSFLNVVIYSLITEHSAAELNIYILDFASETLKDFAEAPQVGEVILSHEFEKITNLFKMIEDEIQKRKKIFTDFGGDYSSYIKSSELKLPSIVIVINNFAAFKELYEEEFKNLAFISREGTKYGIYFVLTTQAINDVRFNMLQNFKLQLVLQLNDESDYSAIVGRTDGLLPSAIKGRGLIKKDKLYEYQTASLVINGISSKLIKKTCKELKDSCDFNKGERAKKVPILPEVVNAEFLKQYIDQNNLINIPIGVETESLEIYRYNFSLSYINTIISRGDEYRDFIENLSIFVLQELSIKTIVFITNHSYQYHQYHHQYDQYLNVFKNASQIKDEIDKLFNLVVYRNNSYKKAISEGREVEDFEGIFIIIDSMSELRKLIDQESLEKLSLILEKGSSKYKINFIIADNARSMSGFCYENWYREHISQIDGIWIGSGIAEQYQLKPNKITSDMREEISNDFAYILNKGKSVKVKILASKSEKD